MKKAPAAEHLRDGGKKVAPFLLQMLWPCWSLRCHEASSLHSTASPGKVMEAADITREIPQIPQSLFDKHCSFNELASTLKRFEKST